MFLIGLGADLNACNKSGHTPLAFGSMKVLRKLNFKDGICSSNANFKKILFRSGRRLGWNNNKLLLSKDKYAKSFMMTHAYDKYKNHPYPKGKVKILRKIETYQQHVEEYDKAGLKYTKLGVGVWK